MKRDGTMLAGASIEWICISHNCSSHPGLPAAAIRAGPGNQYTGGSYIARRLQSVRTDMARAKINTWTRQHTKTLSYNVLLLSSATLRQGGCHYPERCRPMAAEIGCGSDILPTPGPRRSPDIGHRPCRGEGQTSAR